MSTREVNRPPKANPSARILAPPIWCLRRKTAIATAHLIHGFLATGKTTFARQLAEDAGGILLSLDDWYRNLYTDGHPVDHLNTESMSRLWSTLNKLWPQLLRQEVDVILDFGFWSRQSRDEARRLTNAAGATAVLYQLHCSDEVAFERCMRRNRDADAVFFFDPSAYDYLKVRFEPLGSDEDFISVETTALG